MLFDTSTWSPVDLLDFYRQIPPEQVVYASDFPYGQQPGSLLIALKTARYAGYDDDQLRGDARPGPRTRSPTATSFPTPTKPVGRDTYTQPMQLARIHQYLSMTIPLLWTRQADTIGVLGLAINACAERNGHGDAIGRIEELLVAARDLWLTVPEIDDEVAAAADATRYVHRLVHIADIEAVTSA